MKVSIIVPIFNAEKYLKRCLDSLVEQRQEGFEIILVDDGSQDKSHEICMEYREAYQDIKVIRQENRGVSAARNTGLKNVNGDWVLFVDADDALERNYCEIVTSALDDRSDIVMFEFGGSHCPERSAMAHLENMKEFDGGMRGEMIKKVFSCGRLLPEFECNLRSVWGKAYRTSFLMDHKLMFDEGVSYGEDMLFSLRACSEVDGFRCVRHKLYVYFRNADSITNRYKPEFMEMIDDFDKAIAPWLAIHPEYRPYYCNYRLDDISLLMKYIFCHKENRSDGKEKRLAFQKVFFHRKYLEFYKVSKGNRLLKHRSLGYRFVLWLTVHECYEPVRMIYNMKQLQR